MLNTLRNFCVKIGRLLSFNGGASEITNTEDSEYEAQVAVKRVDEVMNNFDEKIKSIESTYPIRTAAHDELDEALANLPPPPPKH